LLGHLDHLTEDTLHFRTQGASKSSATRWWVVRILNSTGKLDVPQLPGSLLDQWKLVRTAARDRHLSRGDIAVLIEIVNNHYRKHGNSRAAFSFLSVATGLSRRTVINSVQRLCKFVYLEIARVGSGTRPTEYVPNWQLAEGRLALSAGEVLLTSETNSNSPLAAPEVNPTSPNPTYVTGLKAELRKEGQASARAAPPPLGPGGPAAGRAWDPFDKLWDAYGIKFERAKAKTEYLRLDPDDALQAQLVRAAADWKTDYERQDRPREFRKRLHNWLAGECWLEDGPEHYIDRRAKIAAKGAKSKSRHGRGQPRSSRNTASKARR
jgi:hypothetical protein